MTYIGIIGAGNISETHARAAREIRGVEMRIITAVYEAVGTGKRVEVRK